MKLKLELLFRYKERHQVQLFGRGHIGGIDIKVGSVTEILYLTI